MTRLLDWIIGREPVAAATGIAAVVTALAGVLTAFDMVVLSAEQIAAIGALAAAVAGWIGRSAVTPVKAPPFPPEHGSVPLALIILMVVGFLIVGGLFASCDALFDDQSEEEDLGLPALVLDHDRYRCMDHDGCGDDWGGGSDGNTGYDGEGGRSGDMDQGGDNNCRNFCDNIIYIPDPRGGEERPR